METTTYKDLAKLEENYEKGFNKWFLDLKKELEKMDVRKSVVEKVFKSMGVEATNYEKKNVVINFLENDYIFCTYDITNKLYDFKNGDVSEKRFNYVSLVNEELSEKGVI